jgi:LPS export ABC transporter protein LptC
MKQVFFIVLALVAALMLMDVRQYIIPSTSNTNQSTKPDVIDYYFSDFTLQSYNSVGIRQHEVAGQHLKHWQAQEKSTINLPQLQSFSEQGQLESTLQASEAILEHKIDHLTLNQAVKIQYAPNTGRDLTLTTDQLQADLNNKLITTDRHVVIQSPEVIMQATGLEAKLNEAFLRLPANVQSVYQIRR